MTPKHALCPSCSGTPIETEVEMGSGEKKTKKKCMDCGTSWFED